MNGVEVPRFDAAGVGRLVPGAIAASDVAMLQPDGSAWRPVEFAPTAYVPTVPEILHLVSMGYSVSVGERASLPDPLRRFRAEVCARVEALDARMDVVLVPVSAALRGECQPDGVVAVGIAAGRIVCDRPGGADGEAELLTEGRCAQLTGPAWRVWNSGPEAAVVVRIIASRITAATVVAEAVAAARHGCARLRAGAFGGPADGPAAAAAVEILEALDRKEPWAQASSILTARAARHGAAHALGSSLESVLGLRYLGPQSCFELAPGGGTVIDDGQNAVLRAAWCDFPFERGALEALRWMIASGGFVLAAAQERFGADVAGLVRQLVLAGVLTERRA